VAKYIGEKKEKSGFFKWFLETKSELKKVIWPTKRQVISNVNTVFLMIVVFGVLVWGFDVGLMHILNFVLDRTPK
jgi:preprotein translocase subunit SecE